MARDDFRHRVQGIVEKPLIPGDPGYRKQSRGGAGSRPSENRAGLGYVVFGIVWGALLGFSATHLNQNYALYFQGDGGPYAGPPLALAGVAFILLSLAGLAIMLLSGLILALAWRFGAKRWTVILTVFLGVGLGNIIATSVAIGG